MSFDAIKQYSRPILKPLILHPGDAPALKSDAQRPRASTSSLWEATVHTFVGTGDRVSPTSWPPSRFNDDPIEIPDDRSYDSPYDVKSAVEHKLDSAESTYRMYGQQLQVLKDGLEAVPLPRIVVKRYIPKHREQPLQKEGRSGLTLLMLAGMGLPKEVFEPMIEGLLSQLQDSNQRIVEIWTVDMPLSGETSLVNSLGYMYGNEKDIARDILLFITAYLPVFPRENLPSELVPRMPTEASRQPVRQNLHVVAHSLGAQSAILASVHAPDLFASLSVFDPAFIPSGKVREAFAKMPKDVLCTNIKAKHESRSALEAELKKNRRTCNWDDRIVKIFVEHGAISDGKDGIRLVAHPRLEWALYYDKETPTHCYDRLQDLRVPFNAVMPQRPFAVPAKVFASDVAKLPQKTRLTWIPKSSHQLPFEKVDECTKHVADWLKDMGRGDRAKL